MQRGPRVLVVNALEEVRSVVAGCLREAYDVEQAGSGREALGILRDGPIPSAVLIDLLLPDIEGEEFLWDVRNNPRLAGIPIIALTGLIRRPGAENADAQIGKPRLATELHAVLADLVTSRQGRVG
jgi:CheY-like chemotaxis protein